MMVWSRCGKNPGAWERRSQANPLSRYTAGEFLVFYLLIWSLQHYNTHKGFSQHYPSITHSLIHCEISNFLFIQSFVRWKLKTKLTISITLLSILNKKFPCVLLKIIYMNNIIPQSTRSSFVCLQKAHRLNQISTQITWTFTIHSSSVCFYKIHMWYEMLTESTWKFIRRIFLCAFI